jgi:phage tail sheath protein FI
MSVRPGTNVSLRSTPPARSIPTDTGTWFVIGTSDLGPANTPTMVRSMADFERIFGLRQSYSVLYDALDVFFREGGSNAVVSRVVGPAAVIASKNLLDAGAGVSLVAKAIGPGATPNGYKVGVRAGTVGGTFVIFVQDVNNVEVETSPDLADQASAINWALASNYIRLTLGATALVPAVAAAAALTGGADDRVNITDTQRQAALDAITTDWGGGQVSEPGNTTDPAHVRLLAHAMARGRVAILDAPDTPTVATLQASVTGARVGNQRMGGMFAPWDIAPGVVSGTTRTVPPCGRICGTIARNDAAGLGAADPAAGDLGEARYVIGLSQPAWDDTTRTTLNTSGINVSRVMFGGVRTYGWRSLVNPVTDPDWKNLGHSRLFMAIYNVLRARAESFVFDKIDGQGRKIAEFGAMIKAVGLDFFSSGDLYGATPDEAFSVDVSPAVNTPTTLANNELHGVLQARFSPFAEYVAIEIVKRPITEDL